MIAGGQTLVPLLSMRMARPKLLLDIMHVRELGGISVEDNAIRVGATVRQAELLAWPELAKRQPLLAQALPWVGHCADARARHRLRLGRARRPERRTAAGAGGARRRHCAVVQAGRRTVTADEFFSGVMSTARNDDELIEAVSFPCARPGEGFAFREFARRHGDFAIVACAAVVDAKRECGLRSAA